MNSAFDKFKRRIWRQHLLKSALVGLSPGLFVFGALLLVTKLFTLDLSPFILIGAPILAFAIPFTLTLLILRPNDSDVAERLDTEFSLGERVQTMLRYRACESDMVSLQREDAEARLLSASLSAIKPKRLVALLVALLLSLSVVIGALAVPITVDADSSTETPVSESDKEMYLISVRRLIEVVRSSFMDESLKAIEITELETLLHAIEDTDHLSVMRGAAIRAVLNINTSVLEVNSAPKISAELVKSDSELLKSLAAAMSEMSASAVRKQIRAIRSEVKGADADAVFSLADGITAALGASGVERDDVIYSAFYVFSASLTSMATVGDFSLIDDVADLLDGAISEPLLTQKDNRLTTDRVLSELIKLFGITEDDLSKESGNDKPLGDSSGGGYEPPKEDVETDKIFDGAIGDEGGDFASGDLVYSPDDDTYVKYSELIDRYLAIAESRFEDGLIDEETVNGIREYFDRLFGQN